MVRFLLVFPIIFSPIFFYGQKEEWDVYMAKYDKGPGSTMLNMALKRIAPIKNLPFIVVTGVKFKDCNADGFPTEKEFVTLYKVSDSVKAIMDGATKNNLAGTFTYQCERLDYYYVADTTRIREKLRKLYDVHFKSYTPYTNIKTDKEWQFYLEFIYPNEETRETMANQKVVIKLQEAGDKLDKPRQVDHWIYFPTEKDRNCFVPYLVQHNFKIETGEKRADSKERIKLHILRTDKVDLPSINKLTLELRKEAKKCNGDYDGWETFVIK
jgi:Family of unknown function (DUF695)/Regulator of ribonuclease activity B